MQNNTKNKKKIAPIIITVAIVLYMVPLLLVCLKLMGAITFDMGDIVALPILLIYVLVGLAIIVGIIVALHQRMKEIDSGEEEEARKY